MACGMGLPVAVASAAAAAALALVRARTLAHVRQQREFASPLDRARDLVLMPAAGAGDATRTDLAAVGDELLEGGDVLVVDELHLRSEEHTSELQSQSNLVCRLLLEKKKKESKR